MDKSRINKTVLFFDRKGFCKESAGRDAGVLAEELDGFYKEIIQKAGAHNGQVVKFMGDAGLLLFDNPDDAVRFARALLSIKEYDSNVGIERGEIVYGTFGKQPLEWTDVIGEAVNEAAINVRRAAKSDKIVLGHQAWDALSIEDRDDLVSAENI
jgi:class 3 adenylate cyclase